MDIDFKGLNVKQEQALREILSRCRYLHEMMKYNLSESVIRSVAEDLAGLYG